MNIETDVHDEWLKWMKEVHILDVLATNLFTEAKISEVLVDEEQGKTYSIQYEVKDLETLQLYQQMYAPKLQAEHTEKFRDKFVAFRTLLKVEAKIKP